MERRFNGEACVGPQDKFECFGSPVVSKGERYLVYADAGYDENPKLKKVLVVNSCNRTALLPIPGLRLNHGDGYDDIPILEKIAFLEPDF